MKKTEFLVLASLLAGLLLLEAGARVFERRLSKDVAHIRSLPSEAARLREAPADALKVLILGNSLARCGLDRAVLRRRLEEQTGRMVEIAAMHPDGSSVEEWHYGYRRYFDQSGGKPDLVLLCTGRLHLLDGLSDLDALAAFYTSWQDLPLFVRRERLGAGQMCQAAAVRVSALFAHRRRVQPLLFYNFMPSYEPTVNLLGRKRASPAGTTAAPSAALNFQGLAATVLGSGGVLMVLQVPLPEAYELPEAVRGMAGELRLPLLKPPLTVAAERFPDGYHLDMQGSALWTGALTDSAEWQAAVGVLRRR